MKKVAVIVLYMLIGLVAFAQESPLPPPKHGDIYVIAHRGAHNGIPENTLAAYQKAIDIGCDFIEIDVRTTADGELVSIHNGDIEAYVSDGKKAAVHTLTLAELKALDIGSRVDPKWKEERIPTLREILTLCKGNIGVYLDFKSADVKKVVTVVKEFGMEKNIVWYAGPHILKQVQEECPHCIPMPDPPTMAMMEKIADELKPLVYAPSFPSLSKEYVKFCHDRGAMVFVDAMEQEQWDKALADGVDGIQTDYPEELIERMDKEWMDLLENSNYDVPTWDGGGMLF